MLYPLGIIGALFILGGVLLIWRMITQTHMLHDCRLGLNRLDDILATSPSGFLCLFPKDGTWETLCSRRLCVQLNLINEHETLDRISEVFMPRDAARLLQETETLLKHHKPFEIRLDTLLGHRIYCVSARSLPETAGAVLWFWDITETEQALKESQALQQKMCAERDMFLKAFHHLPFPCVIADTALEILFQNLPPDKTPQKLTDNWTTIPFQTEGREYTLTYAQDQTREQRLVAEVAERDRLFIAILEELSLPMGLFDAGAHFVAWNQAFARLWHLEAGWLKKPQTYESFLDVIQEKNLLPRVTDFGAYKKQQKELFANLISKSEHFIYLSDGQVLLRQMIPAFQGSILFVDTIQTKTTKEA